MRRQGNGRQRHSLHGLHGILKRAERPDRVVTSGLGQKFPAGYPVGEVAQVSVKPGAPFQTIKVSPLVDANRLSQVLLITARNAATPTQTDIGFKQ